MGNAWLYFTFLALLLLSEVTNVFLLRKSIKTINDAREDGKVTEEEKSEIRLCVIQAILCSFVSALGIAVVIT